MCHLSPRGHWCSRGVKYQCAAGRYGWRYGGSDPDADCAPCAAGYYCTRCARTPRARVRRRRTCRRRRRPRDAHEKRVIVARAAAAAPSYPGAPQTIADPAPCGDTTRYCPRGSHAPARVASGFYTVGGHEDGANATRVAQARCEPGSYCERGIKQPCPAGRYGGAPGLLSSDCSGYCPAGASCPEGSVAPAPCETGTYASRAAGKCSACPGAGSHEGADYGADAKQSCFDSRACCSF